MVGEKEEKEKTAEKTKKSKNNGENGENSAFGRWTFCANELYLKDVPFAKRLFSRLLTARGGGNCNASAGNLAKGNRRKNGERFAATDFKRREEKERLPTFGVGRVLRERGAVVVYF
jgi:hypothetical protein